MALSCTFCKRLNPDDAQYCFHDGRPLTEEAASSPSIMKAHTFASPLLLPTGDACSTYDEFLEFCQDNWSVGAEALQSGLLTAFFQMIGRADLSQAARSAAALADPDIGLDEMLKALPSKAVKAPTLDASPLEIEHHLQVGEEVSFDLRLANRGGRLLYGTVFTDCSWLSLGPTGVVPRKDFKFQGETCVGVRVCGRFLGASARPREAILDVASNGGDAKTVVRVWVNARPFAKGVLAGVASPRDLVERIRQSPAAAAEWLTNGAVASWYQENGWTFPVQGRLPAGIHAVRQFFAALGLPDQFAQPVPAAPPVPIAPPVPVAPPAPAAPPVPARKPTPIQLAGPVGATLAHQLTVKARPNGVRPTSARAASDRPWLQIVSTEIEAASATILLLVSSVPNLPGKILDARVSLTLNDTYQTTVRVSLAIAAS